MSIIAPWSNNHSTISCESDEVAQDIKDRNFLKNQKDQLQISYNKKTLWASKVFISNVVSSYKDRNANKSASLVNLNA